jgi:cytochrome c oxidase assembly protein subunit 15
MAGTTGDRAVNGSGPGARHGRGRALALGFAATVLMWAMAYIALMKPGLVIGELLFAAMLSGLLAAGIVAGRSCRGGESAWLSGLKVGLVSGGLNLLLIGSLIGGGTGPEKIRAAGLWAGGTLAVSMILGAIGGAIGGAQRVHTTRPRAWYALFTRVAAASVFLLLITGGLVTGLEAGLAVPDWPTSFGHNMLLYPLSDMVGGVYYEHAHRLYGMLVGVTAITLAVTMPVFDSRRWMRGLAVAFLVMVSAQGVLGGTRVTETSVALAIVHGVFAQIVFATIIAIAAFTSPAWRDVSAMAVPTARRDRRAAAMLLAVLLVQLVLGAMYRHLNADPAMPIGARHGLLTLHILVGLFVAHLAILSGGRAWSRSGHLPVLPVIGKTLIILVTVQILLGVGAAIAVMMNPAAASTEGQRDPVLAIPIGELVITTLHQATGALLLAAATLLVIWTRRLIGPDEDVSAGGK